MAPRGHPFQRDGRMAFENQNGESSTAGSETVVPNPSIMSNTMYKKSIAILESHIRRTYNTTVYDEAWRNLPEVPTSAEIMFKVVETQTEEQWDDYQKDFLYDDKLPTNIIDGPWPSEEEYIAAHYQIHREDAIACLRKSVHHYKRYPGMMETQETAIYTNITFKGLLCARMGIAFRIEFSTDRSPKQIRWRQSKRLVAGTIVALSPQRDNFSSICKVGVVASRPFEGGLDQNPPQVDIFWGDIDDAAFDPAEKYIMIEARQGYFEASRHMLVALQKLMTEKQVGKDLVKNNCTKLSRFELAKHIVYLDPDIGPPGFLQQNPYMDLNSLVDFEVKASKRLAHDDCLLKNVNVVKEKFPDIEPTTLDFSQMKACRSMLTKRISIIQGPPGTGKTHVSVAALKVMLSNWHRSDPPIVITAQTNHALDQILNHIMEFDQNVVRLGGRADKDNTEILKRTLFELRSKSAGMKGAPSAGEAYARTGRQYKSRENLIRATVQPLLSNNLLSTNVLKDHAIITQEQIDSLWEDGWGDDSEQEAKKNDLREWLTPDQLTKISPTPPVNLGLELEDTEVENEEVEEIEGEQRVAEKEIDRLSGEWFGFQRTVTGKSSSGAISTREIRKLARAKNLFDIPVAYRGEVYRVWEKKLNEKILQELKGHMKEWEAISKEYEIAKNMSNIKMIRFLGIKVIACTTTGLSKYRALLAALEPRILLIEEAAETTEATVTAGMMDSIEQLILVGDHHQLQANCNIRDLGVEPYHLNVSMFERLVNNGIGYTMLNQQRRMISDARQLLTCGDHPFYKDLHDHVSVYDRQVNRPPVPGMGGKDTWFFHHNWPEAKNIDGSSYNMFEAEMISGFYNYLVLNGTKPPQITVLTFYNGQRKTILKELQNNPNLRQYSRFKVHTVDSYQGEENDVILLSLVRSNERMGIGFLENRNRAVVALSRARRGFYLFGNSVTLIVGEQSPDYIGRPPLWSNVLDHLKLMKRIDIDNGMPVTCINHGKTNSIYEPGDWVGFAGGCHIKCMAKLPCNHPCPYTCHPFPHEEVICPKPCSRRVQSCGHACSGICGERCYCDQCKVDYQGSIVEGVDRFGNTPGASRGRGQFGGNSDIRQTGGSDETPPQSWPAVQGYQMPGNRNGVSASPSNALVPGLGHVSTPEKWQGWDAESADRALYFERLREQAEKSRVDPDAGTLVETFKHTGLDKDGRRVQIGVERRVASGYSEDKKGKAPEKTQSSAQTLADEFGVITIAEGPSTFNTGLSAWEQGQVTPTSQHKRSAALSPTLSIARTVHSKKSDSHPSRAPSRGYLGSSAPAAPPLISGYRRPSPNPGASASPPVIAESTPTQHSSKSGPLAEPTPTQSSSNSGPLIPGFEADDEETTSPEPAEEDLLINFS